MSVILQIFQKFVSVRSAFILYIIMFVEHLAEILTGIASVAALWFTYNLYTKNKMTDYKIEKWKEEEKKSSIKKAGDIATIYGELWELLHFLKADRVYLIQPHPLYKSMYVSVTLEVKRQGVSSTRELLTDITISSVAKFASDLANTEYVFIEDLEEQEVDKKIRSILLNSGSKAVAIRRITDEQDHWIGNIIVDFTRDIQGECKCGDVKKELVEKMTRSSAQVILYILPEFKTLE